MEKGKRACHWRMSISRAIVEVAVTSFPPFKIGSGFHALMLSLQLPVNFLPPGQWRSQDGFDPDALSIAKKEVGIIYMVKFN